MTILMAIIGVFVGLVMGLTGAGGGVLAVPALIGIMGWTMQQAAPVALVAVASGATIGTIEGLKRGLVRYRAALLMAAVGLPFTVLGQSLARVLSEQWLKLMFGTILLWVGIRLWRESLHNTSNTGPNETQAELRLGTLSSIAKIDPDTQRFVWNYSTALLLSGLGAITGFTAGLLGVGGGFVLVPLFLRFTPLTMHGAIATSLMVMALVSTGAVASAMLRGLNLPLPSTLIFAMTAIIGVLIGRVVSHRLPPIIVQRVFATLLLAVSATMLFKLCVS